MPIRMNVSATDVKRSTIIAPGWVVAEIVEIAEAENSKKDGFNTVVDFIVREPAKYDGVPLRTWITEKEGGAASRIAFMTGLGFKVGEEGVTAELEEDKIKGRKMKLKIRTGTWNNSPRNEIEDYAPIV